MIVVFFLVIVISLVAGFTIGYLKHRNKIRKILSNGTGRFGILQYSHFIIEIEEIESAGSLTKVKVIDIKRSSDLYTQSELLRTADFKEWVPTSNITWYNDNSQRMREEKLNKILNK